MTSTEVPPYAQRVPAGFVKYGPGEAAPPTYGLPSWTTAGPDFPLKATAEYIKALASGGSPTAVTAYLNGATVVDFGYTGSVYSPFQKRIYFVPSDQAALPNWHYVDCLTGAIVAYAHGASGLVTPTAYDGGVYSPTQNRIYFVPSAQATAPTWHYIDCATGTVVAYAHGATGLVSNAYSKGVYSPSQNRIYFVPGVQAPQPIWHYVDCATGAIVAYANNVSGLTGGAFFGGAYGGGAYSPSQNRIYFCPYVQGNQPQWHYVDCNTGAIVAYPSGPGAVSGAYFGAAFSPTQNRIYFAPSNQSTQPVWHYIDCSTGAAVAYAHGASGISPGAYFGCVFSPTQNRVYFVPAGQAPSPSWHYVDCNTGQVVAYSHGSTTAVASAYTGASFSPETNRIYFGPRSQGPQPQWHFIADLSDVHPSVQLMAGPLFNKY